MKQPSSVGFLISSSCARSSVFFRLTSSGICHQKRTIVLEQQLFNFSLFCFIHVLLVVRYNSFRQGLSDSVNLGYVTSTSNSDSDIQILESLQTEKQNWLEDLNSERLRLKEFNRRTIDSEYSFAGSNSCDCDCVFFSSKALGELVFGLWHMVIYFNK